MQDPATGPSQSAESLDNSLVEEPQKAGSFKPCSSCCEPIHTCAKKCTHCDSYQDWRRHLVAAGSVVPLMVSIVAVLISLGPFARQAWRDSDSAIQISAPTIQSGHLFLLATNSGKMAGTVDEVKLELPIAGANAMWLHLMRPERNSGIVPADSVKGLPRRVSCNRRCTGCLGSAWNHGDTAKTRGS
jgi:hypothetical protein